MNKGKLIFLKKIKYGESDLIIYALTEQGAQIHLMAKGALRSRKRFGPGVLEPTHVVDAIYGRGAKAKDDSLYLLKEARLLEDFSGLRKDYEKLEMALYCLRLVSHVSQEGIEDAPELYDLLGHGLQQIEKGARLPLLRLHFEIRLLYHQGFLSPEANCRSFLEYPLRDHHQVNCEERELSTLRDQIDLQLKRDLSF